MLDINGGELVVLVVLAVMLIGPERLPRYAAQLGALVRRGKALLMDAKSRVDTELGPELKDVDWSKLDPRQYDPRRIVRDALLDDTPTTPRPADGMTSGMAAGGMAAAAAAPRPAAPDGPAPFDDEAT
ncbi:Sec-independent protein translocase TatB [Isoptericola sp. NEAU-Y5]|uniref:Sec-independent protein translocase TatB n=1 Tax=Isoptericola luteus TaxID=2879484 RepID=A0ABS7ZBU6_9MICO|nr:Sec-independent protein translocase TatB [Isoptericola sp. NEAU-Y5]MCA5892378.1 Sec-independent protein translocase TatB [Isoptericola sp. NEAU-Y5]